MKHRGIRIISFVVWRWWWSTSESLAAFRDSNMRSAWWSFLLLWLREDFFSCPIDLLWNTGYSGDGLYRPTIDTPACPLLDGFSVLYQQESDCNSNWPGGSSWGLAAMATWWIIASRVVFVYCLIYIFIHGGVIKIIHLKNTSMIH